MEKTQEATALAINSSNLQQIALNASDARLALEMESDDLNFRKEMSRIFGVYVEPNLHQVTIDGVRFAYGNDRDNRQRCVFGAIDIGANGKTRVVRAKITSLSDLGALVQEANDSRIPNIYDYHHPGAMIDESVIEHIDAIAYCDEFICFTEDVLALGETATDSGGVSINYTLGSNGQINATVDASPVASKSDIEKCLSEYKDLNEIITLYVK